MRATNNSHGPGQPAFPQVLAVAFALCSSLWSASAGSAERRIIASKLFNIPISDIDHSTRGANYDYNPFGAYPSTECGYRGGHSGVDMQTKTVAGSLTANETFYSVSTGTVLSSPGGTYGTIAVYDSARSTTVLYIHARSIFVSAGQSVSVGMALGIQGDTGVPGAEHVHLEARSGSRNTGSCGAQDSLDPEPIIMQYLSSAGPLAPPALVSPGSSTAPGPSVSTLRPDFQWQSVANADGYALYISKYNGSSYSLVFNSEEDVGSPLTGTSYRLPSGLLEDGARYRWNMATHNGAGYGSPNSARNYFTVSATTATRIIALSGDLNFGDVAVGSSVQRNLTVANTGNSPLTLHSLSYPDGFLADWPVTVVPAGGSTVIPVYFSPTSAGSFSSVVTVNSDKTSGTNTRAVTGNGVNPSTVSTPTFSPNGGEFAGGSVNVTVSCATSGATIRYTLDGSAPSTSSPSIANGGAVTVPVPGQLKAMGTRSGYANSPVRSASFTAAAAGGNDMFAQRTVIPGSRGTMAGSNQGATRESGEPDHVSGDGASSVWWSWTPGFSGAASLDTSGSSFDTLLAIYTGGSVNNLTLVAQNDDGIDGSRSKVTLTVQSGTNYKIAVDGFAGATGDIRLTVQPVSAAASPANNSVASTRRPRFEWTATPGATWHQLLIKRDGILVLEPWVEGALQWTPASDLAAGAYSWQIRAWSPAAGMGGLSAMFAFSIPSLVPGLLTQIGPSGVQTSSSLNYRWTKDSRATWYRLYSAPSNGPAFHDHWYSLTGTGQAAVNIAGHRSGDHAWWLQGWGPDGFGPWSGPMSFSTPSADPDRPLPGSPSGTISTRAPDFQWTTVPRAQWYWVYVMRGDRLAFEQWTQAKILATPGTLQAGSHTWWLGAWNDVTRRIVWSAPASFTVQ